MINEILYKHAVKYGDIKKVLQHLGIAYSEYGDEVKIQCPNPKHQDRNPSATVNVNRNSSKYTWFSCFGCNFSGKLPKLYATLKQCSTEKAMIEITKILKDDVKNVNKNIIQKDFLEEEEQFEILLPEEYQEIKLMSGSSYYRYLQKRGLSDTDILSFDWGFCAKGYYAKRVILPIYMNGKIVSFYTRHITCNIENRKVRNALNSKMENVVFPYDYINKSLDYIWVTESAFNFFSLKNIGIKNCVCFFGNKLTTWRCSFLNQFKEIRIVPDGDDPGMDLVRNIYYKFKENHIVKHVDMIEEEDANSISPKELKNVIETLHDTKIGPKVKVNLETWQ